MYEMVAKIKSGDLVKVIRGKDRGKEGTVKRVLKDDRLIVEGVQMVKKHVRATPMETTTFSMRGICIGLSCLNSFSSSGMMTSLYSWTSPL